MTAATSPPSPPSQLIDLSWVTAVRGPATEADLSAALAEEQARYEEWRDVTDEEIEEEWERRKRETSWDNHDVPYMLHIGLPPDDVAELVQRTDGVPLLYRGKVSGIMGEPESGKGWFAVHAAAQLLAQYVPVLYVDFEDNVVPLLKRFRKVGVDDQQLHFLSAVNPTEPLEGKNMKVWRRVLETTQPQLVILDGVTQALSNDGRDYTDNKDVVQWFNEMARPITRIASRPAVLIVDHVTKSTDNGKRYALGAGQKLAAIDGSQFLATVIKSFDRKKSGRVNIEVTKDRPGAVREHAEGDKVIQVVASMTIDPKSDEYTEVRLHPPGTDKIPKTPDKQIVPTAVMDRMMAVVTSPGQPPLNKTELRALVQGNAASKVIALNELLKNRKLIYVKEDGDKGPMKLFVHPLYKAPIKLTEETKTGD